MTHRVGASVGPSRVVPRSSADSRQHTGPDMGCRYCPFGWGAGGLGLWQTRRPRLLGPGSVRPLQDEGSPTDRQGPAGDSGPSTWSQLDPSDLSAPLRISVSPHLFTNSAALHNALHIICILSSTHHPKPSQSPVACPPCLPLSAPAPMPSP